MDHLNIFLLGWTVGDILYPSPCNDSEMERLQAELGSLKAQKEALEMIQDAFDTWGGV